MANVLAQLAADIYKSADIVGREQTGFVSSVTINAGSEQAALNDIVRSAFTRPATVITPVPSMTVPEGTDQAVDNKTMTLDTPMSVQIPWTGEDIKHVNNGPGFSTIYGDQIVQAFRAIANSIEAKIALALSQNASRAWGTAGTTPFASAFSEMPQLRKILVDNGCPMDGQVSLVLNTTAGANLRSLAQLNKINESGQIGSLLLNQGELINLQGFRLKESAGIQPHVAGNGAGYVTSGSTAVGVASIALVTGSGNLFAGDVVTVAADTANKYVVNTGVTAPGTIALGTPGSRIVIPTGNALTVGNSFTPNVGFHKSAVELGIRPLAKPPGGDIAVDEMIVQDPWSGLVFRISAYKGYYKAMFDVTCVCGVKVWKPDFVSLLLG